MNNLKNNFSTEMKKSYLKYSLFLGISFILTLIGAMCTQFLPEKCNHNVIILIPLAIIFGFLYTEGVAKKIFFLLFCYIEGLGLGYLCDIYSKGLFLNAICITTIVVILSMILGFYCKDISFLGYFLNCSLLIVLVYIVLRMFFYLPSISLLIVFLFMIFVAYDINKFKLKLKSNNGKLKNDEILNEVMDMYLDVLNILLNILDLLKD